MLARVRFFSEHCFYAVGYRMSTAVALARAEERANELGLVFVWEPEEEAWDGDVPLAPTDLLEWAACYEADGIDRHGQPIRRPLSSLGMVTTTSYSDPYRRVVEAELALEALAVLDSIDRVEADKLAARATFAGVES
jgi:hypothetical protein